MTGSAGQPPGIPIPNVRTPPNGLGFPDQATADASGRGVAHIKANTLSPALPRGYIDGQLYGIGYQLPQSPADTDRQLLQFRQRPGVQPYPGASEPDLGTGDIQPILTQYGNLYPIMSRHLVDLSDYGSVVRHLNILRLAFSLPVEDPNQLCRSRRETCRMRSVP